MRLQVLSDLHLETEFFDPEPADDAEALVLAGDIDATWQGLEKFRDWPVPVLFVPGNHEFDGRELLEARPALRDYAAGLGIIMLDFDTHILVDGQGRRVRFVGNTRWCDFDAFGPAQRERAMRAGSYFQRVMGATCAGKVFDVAAVREQGLQCRAWLEEALAEAADGRWDAQVAITHFAPSLRSADQRYGKQPGTASFCNNDEDLLPRVSLWLHGHLHCRHDYAFAHAAGHTRVLSNTRGLLFKGEAAGHDPLLTLEVFAS
jgi:hypothetical protein